MRLILASASPRRAELLTAAGYTFEVRPVDVDESVRTGESPAGYVRRLAMEKAVRAAGLDRRTDEPGLVLAADTAVVIGGRILGKPRDDAESRAMLEQLSGRAHQVLTGICMYAAGSQPLSRVEHTVVWFSRLSHDEISWYVSSGEGSDKAGAYAIQGLAARFIPRIDGSYSNVVGLPIAAVHELTTMFSVPKFR